MFMDIRWEMKGWDGSLKVLDPPYQLPGREYFAQTALLQLLYNGHFSDLLKSKGHITEQLGTAALPEASVWLSAW